VNEATAADFARRFAEYWKAPTPAGLDTVLAERVRLIAPMTPVTHTIEEGQRAFASLLASVDDLTAEVHRWGATDDGVPIVLTAARRPRAWPAFVRSRIGG
jgi:hypothetical protein